MGGAYNPMTLAHLAIAETVVKTFGIQEVLFLLPAVPPHKTIFGASLEQRLEMMQLAVEERPNMPGTTDQWPNWCLALPAPLERLEESELAADIARSLRRSDG